MTPEEKQTTLQLISGDIKQAISKKNRMLVEMEDLETRATEIQFELQVIEKDMPLMLAAVKAIEAIEPDKSLEPAE